MNKKPLSPQDMQKLSIKSQIEKHGGKVAFKKHMQELAKKRWEARSIDDL